MDISSLWAVLQMGVSQAAETASATSGEDFRVIGACAAAALCTSIGVFAAGLSEGYTAAKACEGIARNPQASGSITRAMMLGQAITETTAIYAFVISLVILIKVVF